MAYVFIYFISLKTAEQFPLSTLGKILRFVSGENVLISWMLSTHSRKEIYFHKTLKSCPEKQVALRHIVKSPHVWRYVNNLVEKWHETAETREIVFETSKCWFQQKSRGWMLDKLGDVKHKQFMISPRDVTCSQLSLPLSISNFYHARFVQLFCHFSPKVFIKTEINVLS